MIVKNTAIYFGLDQALSILGRSARERAEALQEYPDLAEMPSDLVYELILNLAEAGDYEHATALFHDRLFPREEGGTNVREVWIEVQLRQSLMLARQRRCSDALAIAGQLGSPVTNLSFTKDGLEPFLKEARTTYLLGLVFSECGKRADANSSFEIVSKATGLRATVWAWRAAQQLPHFDHDRWQKRLQDSLAQLNHTPEVGAWWFYTTGLIQQALGRNKEAKTAFRKVCGLIVRCCITLRG